MKSLLADLVFASGWVAVGLGIAWSQRRRRRQPVGIAVPTIANRALPDPVQHSRDLIALASATENANVPQVHEEGVPHPALKP